MHCGGFLHVNAIQVAEGVQVEMEDQVGDGVGRGVAVGDVLVAVQPLAGRDKRNGDMVISDTHGVIQCAGRSDRWRRQRRDTPTVARHSAGRGQQRQADQQDDK